VRRDASRVKSCGSGSTRTKKNLGSGDPYLDKDPPRVAPIDGKEYAEKRNAAVLSWVERRPKALANSGIASLRKSQSIATRDTVA